MFSGKIIISSVFLSLAMYSHAETNETINTTTNSAPSAMKTDLPVHDTELDQRREKVSTWLDDQSQKLDGWFGTPDPNRPATASLRIILDNSWDKHNDYEIRPRIRGKLQLPTLERKFSLVFGDDSLDDELETNIAILNENPALPAHESYDRTRIRDDNSSIALRWSELSKDLGIDTDVDLGLRSGNDIYLRFKVAKDWQVDRRTMFLAEQIYR